MSRHSSEKKLVTHVYMLLMIQLQKIMSELQHLKGAVHADRHVHIDINSTHMSEKPDGSPTQSAYTTGSTAGSRSRSAPIPTLTVSSQTG